MKTTGIKNIYFAMDYLISSNTNQAQSDTFREIGPKHHEVIQIFYLEFNPHTWVTTKALHYLYNYLTLCKVIKTELSKGQV